VASSTLLPELSVNQDLYFMPQSILLRRTMLQQRLRSNAAASCSRQQAHCYTGRQRRLSVSARLAPPKVVVSQANKRP